MTLTNFVQLICVVFVLLTQLLRCFHQLNTFRFMMYNSLVLYISHFDVIIFYCNLNHKFKYVLFALQIEMLHVKCVR